MGEEGLQKAARRSREAASKCAGLGPPLLLACCEGSEDLPRTDVSPEHPAPPHTPPTVTLLPSAQGWGHPSCWLAVRVLRTCPGPT